MRKLVAFILCSGCISSTAEVDRRTFALESRKHDRYFYVGDRLVEPGDGITFVRGKRTSPRVFAASLIVGTEGICLSSHYDVARFWRAVRIAEVDPRIEGVVLPALVGVTLTRVAEKTWEVRGTTNELRRWIVQHMYRREKALRSYVDLPTMTYFVNTSLGWRAIDRGTLERLAAQTELSGYDASLVGWSWSDFDRVRYHGALGRSRDEELAHEIDKNDRVVQQSIDEASGLPPGPCPLLDGGTPLLK